MIRPIGAVLCVLVLPAPQAGATTLPSGFVERVLVAGVNQPTSMVFAPDGRMLVTEKTGALRVVENGTLLSSPAAVLALSSESERGLLGIALDPAFAANGFVYVYYTTSAGSAQPLGHPFVSPRNRVSRLTLAGNTVVGGSEVIVLDDIPSDAGNHNAGWIQFGPDGKLYVSTGDGGAAPSNSQDLTNLAGKILRINADGTVPSDNPFFATPGVRREVWCYGLRNPWRFTFDPAGRLFIGDVGSTVFEEINIGGAGLNFGWPHVEGVANNPAYVDPIYAYAHGAGASISLGVFADSTAYPAEFRGVLFFGDFSQGFIQTLRYDPATGTASVSGFATGATNPVHFAVGLDGRVHYVAIGANEIRRIEFPSQPTLAALRADREGPIAPGTPISWTADAYGVTALEYLFWLYSAAPDVWTIGRDYSPDPRFTWIPGRGDEGTFAVQVWVRNAGSNVPYSRWLTTPYFNVSSSAAAVIHAVTANAAFPAAPRTPIMWTAKASGGRQRLQYRFWLYSAASDRWTLAQDYSFDDTSSWTPGPGDQGQFALQVWVRSTGSFEAYEAWHTTGYFTVSAATPAAILGISANRTFPAAPLTPIVWTATASGGTARLQYRFWLYSAASDRWTLVQDYGFGNMFSWLPGPGDAGTFALQVWVRSAGSSQPYEAWRTTTYFTISP